MPEIADYRAVWAGLESGRQTSIDHLELAGEMAADNARYCLNFYIRHGYVDMCGTKRAASGECLPVFKLIERTGPEAPHPDENGRLVDPNARTPQRERCRGLFKAQVRLVAERAGGLFTLREFRRVVENQLQRSFPKGKKFDSIWAQLKRSGEIVRVESCEPELAGTWEYRPHAEADAFRRYFKERAGMAISSAELKRDMRTVNGGIIREALNLLIAEGFKVTVTPAHKGAVVYRIDPPEAADGR